MSFKMNIAAFILFCIIPELSLADAIVDEKLIISAYTNVKLEETDTVQRNINYELTENVVEEAFEVSEKKLKERSKLEIKLAEKGRVIKNSDGRTNPSLIHTKTFDPFVRAREHGHLPLEEASYHLYKRFNLSRDDINRRLPNVPLNGEMSSTKRDNCMDMISTTDCDANSRYRTANGECNNLENPTWGSAMSCQQRLVAAHYEGNSEFRVSVDGDPLPDPRNLSLNLHNNLNRPTEDVSHMYMFFGQLLDHDIALTPFSTTVDNQAIQCCPPEDETHPQCAPILLSDDDPFYSEFNMTCLNFVRSAICPTCTMGARLQTDAVTSFIDASFVYGNSDNETASLRMNDGTGRLRVQSSRYGDLLPPSPDPENDQCSFPETNDICFEAGDSRANQHTVLTSLHTIFMREHNRLAGQLRAINPNWDEERLFQEARRILGAEMQTITYKEYLPITLGDDTMDRYRLWMGRTTMYENSGNPSMMLEFTTAAFRFGHSLINSVVTNRPLNSTGGRRLLRNEFFQPFDLYNGFTGPLVRGASNSPAQRLDRHVVPDVTNYLYRRRGRPTGGDLAATNINRGRDHGIPTYVEMVRFCSGGAVVINSFSDLVRYRLMRRSPVNALRRNYRYVEDVDLWPGIIMETPNVQAVVGPTAACILGRQFQNLKFNDRFYLEHINEAGSFTYQQLLQLRRVTLSQIICLNTEVQNIAKNAMLFSSNDNPLIRCRRVRGVNLSYWKE